MHRVIAIKAWSKLAILTFCPKAWASGLPIPFLATNLGHHGCQCLLCASPAGTAATSYDRLRCLLVHCEPQCPNCCYQPTLRQHRWQHRCLTSGFTAYLLLH